MPDATPLSSRSACAVVVTHNRRELLRRCLTALREQDAPLGEILVIDNASSDGTPEMLSDEFPDAVHHRLSENRGGAAGFALGIRLACERGWDWIWVMDDDTIPRSGALGALCRGVDRARPAGEPSLLASRVLWTDGSVHPLNVPGLKAMTLHDWTGLRDRGVDDASLIPIRYASFVSVFVRRTAVEQRGLPHPEFEIWNDDLEFTGRLLRSEPGYLVLGSEVEHRTTTLSRVWQAKPERFYFEARNKLLVSKTDSFTRAEKIHHLRTMQHDFRRYLRFHSFQPAALLAGLRGLADGVRMRLPAPSFPSSDGGAGAATVPRPMTPSNVADAE